MRLVLFDIDGTLVSVQREVTRGVLLAAVQAVLGQGDPFERAASYRFHGRTDRTIFIDVAAMMGVAREDALPLLPRFEEILMEGWNASLNRESVRTLPGIAPLLDQLIDDPNVTLGLLTGNIERGARAKLHPHDLNRFFSFGAYGSDAIERVDLPPIALERANTLNGNRFSFDHAVIIGDSNRDVECAQAWGIRSLAVATGGLNVDELRQYNPDGVMETLEDTEGVIEFIRSK